MYLSFFVDVTTLFLTFLNFIVMLLMSMEEFSSLENLGKRVLCYLHSLGCDYFINNYKIGSTSFFSDIFKEAGLHT